MGLNDQDSLVQGLRQGDPEAQGMLLSQYGQEIIRFLIATCGTTTDESEDIAVETLYRAVLRIDSFILTPGSSTNALRNWLFTIARNHWRDLHRRKIHTVSLPDDDRGIPGLLQLETSSKEPSPLVLAVREGLAGLPERQRQTLILHYGGLDLSQVAAVLDAQPGTVRQWKRRGLQTLKLGLEQDPTVKKMLSGLTLTGGKHK